MPLASISVARIDLGNAYEYRLSGTYPSAKRDGTPAPEARIASFVPRRIIDGQAVPLLQAKQYRIGRWEPGVPFATTFRIDKSIVAAPAALELRLCIGENDGPGHNYCFWSPNLVKDGPQHLIPSLKRSIAPPATPQ